MSTPNDEKEFLDGYDAHRYARPSVTVDLVIFTVLDTDLKVLLIQRAEHPEKGKWALPGGFLRVREGEDNQGEDLEAAAHRELAEETGLPIGSAYLEQLYTFGRAGRDPRTRVISGSWYALIRPDLAPVVTAGSDASAVSWFSLEELPPNLAFDHGEILGVGVERIRGKIDYAPIAFDLVPPAFTIAELRAVYEAVKGEPCDAGNFRRRFLRMQSDGLVEKAPGKRLGSRKPSAVFRFLRR